MRLLAELRRRNVFKVAAGYAVVAWLLAQAAVVLETSLALPGWFDGLVVSLLLLGFPVAVLLAWAFELTPEGVKPTDGAAIHGRVLAFGATGAAALALAIFGGRALLVDTTPAPPSPDLVEFVPTEQSIAVLKFQDFSPERDQAYFAEGISEELLNTLARTEGLRVASRTSAFSYSGDETPIPRIAEALGVRHVLEGSVRKAGDQLRITAQLIDTESDTHLWSDTYDRALSPEAIFAIQEDISREIVRELQGRLDLLPESTGAATTSQEALELYLRGKSVMEQRTKLAIDQAIADLTEAVTLDPDFALAHSKLARAYSLAGAYTEMTEEQSHRLATLSLGKALALAPDHPDILSDKAWVQFGNAPNSELLQLFEAAIAANPNNAEAWRGKAITLRNLGRHDEITAALERAAELDPRSFMVTAQLAAHYNELGRIADRNVALRRAFDINPDFGAGLSALVDDAFDSGDFPLVHRLLKQNENFHIARQRLNNLYRNFGLVQHIQRPTAGMSALLALDAGDVDTALEIASSNGIDAYNATYVYYMANRLEDADRVYRGDPLFDTSLELARDAENLPNALKVGTPIPSMIYALKVNGDPEADTLLANALAAVQSLDISTPQWLYGKMTILTTSGRIDEAFATLDRIAAIGHPYADFAIDPALEPLRADPRWQAAMAKLQANADVHRAAIEAQLANPPDVWWSPDELEVGG